MDVPTQLSTDPRCLSIELRHASLLSALPELHGDAEAATKPSDRVIVPHSGVEVELERKFVRGLMSRQVNRNLPVPVKSRQYLCKISAVLPTQAVGEGVRNEGPVRLSDLNRQALETSAAHGATKRLLLEHEHVRRAKVATRSHLYCAFVQHTRQGTRPAWGDSRLHPGRVDLVRQPNGPARWRHRGPRPGRRHRRARLLHRRHGGRVPHARVRMFYRCPPYSPSSAFVCRPTTFRYPSGVGPSDYCPDASP